MEIDFAGGARRAADAVAAGLVAVEIESVSASEVVVYVSGADPATLARVSVRPPKGWVGASLEWDHATGERREVFRPE